MKKNYLLLALFIFLQSCFYTHKARRISVYDLDKPKKEGEGLTSYTFELTGSKKRFDTRSIDFFNINENYLPFSFETDTLFEGEFLTVFISSGTDRDKLVNLFSLVWNAIFSRDDEDDNRYRNSSNDSDDNQMSLYDNKTKHEYIFLQITNKNGEDVLAKQSFKRQAVLQKLNQYLSLVNH